MTIRDSDEILTAHGTNVGRNVDPTIHDFAQIPPAERNNTRVLVVRKIEFIPIGKDVGFPHLGQPEFPEPNDIYIDPAELRLVRIINIAWHRPHPTAPLGIATITEAWPDVLAPFRAAGYKQVDGIGIQSPDHARLGYDRQRTRWN